MVKLLLAYGSKPHDLPKGVCVDGLFNAIREAAIMQNGGDEGYKQKVKAIIDKYFAGKQCMEIALWGTITLPKSRYLHFYNLHDRLEVISAEALADNRQPYCLCTLVWD